MRISKIGVVLAGVYVLLIGYLILTQGLFGESFISLILGLPWSFLVVAFAWFDIAPEEIFIYVLVLAPLLLNTLILYWLGSLISKTRES